MTDDVSIWMALGDPKRRQIVNLLEEKPRTTSDLSEYFDVSRFAVMKHLKVLEQANLVKVKREGRQRWNILNDDLAHFLRTKLADDNGSDRLTDILGLFPGHETSGPAIPTDIKKSIHLQASPSKVFEALTVDIDAWWSLRASTGSKIFLEPYVNGRFYEAFSTDGQGILYATVTYIKQDEELRLRGTVELAEQVANTSALDNIIRITLESADNGTQLSLSNRIFGRVDKSTRDICENRWHILLNRHLKPFVENGLHYQQLGKENHYG